MRGPICMEQPTAIWIANYFSITPVVSSPGITSTTSLGYDLDGNVTSVVTGATTTTYADDYLNRLATSTVAGVTTTYGYDASGIRVFETSGNTTTVFPSKWYSVTTTSSATSTGTSTDYVFLPAQAGQDDRLLATVDQPLVNGAPSGSSTIRYVHTDNLGSTAVTSDANGNLAQSFDYAPYGSVLASTNTGTTTASRQFIGQFTDNSGLSYLQNRYYNAAQGQFLSQDPLFLAVGNQTQLQQLSQQDQQNLLSDPQGLNAYGYSRDNPITNKDPQGLLALKIGGEFTIPGWALTGSAGIYVDQNGIDYYYGTGVAAGGGGNIGAQVTTADLPHTYSVSTSVFASGGAYVGGEIEKGMTYYPYSNQPPQAYSEAGIGASAELDAGGMTEFSGPLWVWNQPSAPTNYSLSQPQLVNNLNVSEVHTGSYQSAAPGRASGGGSLSEGQVLSNLQSALQQLGAALSSRSNSYH